MSVIATYTKYNLYSAAPYIGGKCPGTQKSTGKRPWGGTSRGKNVRGGSVQGGNVLHPIVRGPQSEPHARTLP